MHRDQVAEGVDLLVCPTIVLDRSSHHRVWRCDVRRPAPARKSDDHADSSHAESEFRKSFPNHWGLHSSVYFLDTGLPLLWRVGQGRFRMEPGPTEDLQNPLESAVEERWERYLQEGVLETPDLSFSTPSWAGVESMPLLLSEQPEAQQLTEARHPTEANSVPPGFACIHRKAPEEQEATRYETPADSKQSIDEELSIQDVTNITEDWYAQSELASAIKSVLQPMEVDEPPEEPPRISDEEAPDMLGPNLGSGSPVTAAEDRALDTPGGFSRAPGDGRPITGSAAGSSSRRITGRSTEG